MWLVGGGCEGEAALSRCEEGGGRAEGAVHPPAPAMRQVAARFDPTATAAPAEPQFGRTPRERNTPLLWRHHGLTQLPWRDQRRGRG